MSYFDDVEQETEDTIIKNLKKEINAIKRLPWNTDICFKRSLNEISVEISNILEPYREYL